MSEEAKKREGGEWTDNENRTKRRKGWRVGGEDGVI